MKCGRSIRKGDIHIDYLLSETFWGGESWKSTGRVFENEEEADRRKIM